MILAGDIGGTKVNLGIFDFVAGELRLKQSIGYRVEELDSLDFAIEEFLKVTEVQVKKVSLGVAGPVSNGRCQLTNVGITIDQTSLKSRFGFSEVVLVNDLAATAASLPLLKETDLCVLQPGKPVVSGRKGVISSGTGLGQAYFVPQGEGEFQALDTEGGHCGFAPTNEEQLGLCSQLMKEGASVAIEDVLSGTGLERIYQYLKESEKSSHKTKTPTEKKPGLTATEIVEEGCREVSSLCHRVINLFSSILGAVSGDMALRLLTRGGVYIGGGIPPKILQESQQRLFLEAFRDKNKFRGFMESVPVFLIMNELAPLWGAANILVNPKIKITEN